MLKKVIGLAFTLILSICFSVIISQPVSANANDIDTKTVITEDSTSTSDAIEKIREKLESRERVRVIIGLKDGTELPNYISSPQTIINLQDSFYNDLSSVLNIKKDEIVNFETVPYVSIFVNKDAFEYLLQSPNIASIEEDIPVKLKMAESNGIIGTKAAWDLGFTGKGQTVVILDTGVDKNHTFLKGKVVDEACYSTQYSNYDYWTDIESLCPGKVSESHAVGSGLHCKDIALGCDHGTHVAGTVAGKEVSVSGKKISGVAKDANLISVQVFSKIYDYWYGETGIGSFNTDQLKALEYIYSIRNKYNISSVNMSLGGGRHFNYCSSDIRNAIFNRLTDSGIAVVVASGNEYYNNSVSAPACIESAITVGATTDSDTVTNFSNSANMVDLLAPGHTITSSVPGGGYETWPGTSMATPHVAGAWAVLKEMKPNASVNEVLTFLQKTGKPVRDSKNSIIKQRIDLSKVGEFTETISSLEATPNSLVLTQGKSAQLTITARYQDGKTENVTDKAIYTSDNVNLATVSNTGLVTIPVNSKNGTYNVTASFGGKSVVIPVTVSVEADNTAELTINPDTINLEVGKTSKYTVTIKYKDGKSKVLTTSATAQVVDSEGNLVKDITATKGTLRALSSATKGNYKLNINYEGAEAAAEIKVSPVLSKLSTDRASLVITTANPEQLKITAHYKDKSSEDVTEVATYTSSNLKLLNVDATGKITVVDSTKTGSAKITVKYGTKTISIPVTVEKVVTGIEIQEDSLTVEIGKTTRYTVKVTYEDGSSKDITKLAETSIENGDDITTTKGTIRALKTAEKGDYTFKVSYGGKEDTVTLKVVPVLSKLLSDQSSYVITSSSPGQLLISAQYNDNSSEDVTEIATYKSSNSKLVSVDETGKITVVDNTKTGSAKITVKYGTKTLSIPVTVEKVVTGIEIQEDSLTVEIGKTTRYTVKVTYEDGSSKDTTKLAETSIENGDGITTTKGTIRALKTAEKGDYTFKVSYGGKEDTITLKVVPVLSKLLSDQSSYVITSSSPGQLAISAQYNDNSSENVTEVATYKSSNSKLVSVDEIGKITVVDNTKTGSAKITVKYGTKTLSIPVTVEKVVTGVEIQEDSLTVEIGKTTRYTVKVTYEDGSSKDITKLAEVSVVDGDGITASKGTIRTSRTAEKGDYTIKVSYGEYEDIVTLSVVPVLTKLLTEQTSISISSNETVRLTVNAIYNDNSVEDVTSKAKYSSNKPRLVSVDSDGHIHSVEESKNGSARITVKYGGKTLNVRVTLGNS